MPAATLTYDNLPPGGDITVARGPDGVITITAPAGEPPAAMTRVVAQQSAIFSAALSAGIVLGLLALFHFTVQFDRFPAELRVWGVVWFIVFCAALFALYYRLRYAELERRLQRARNRATILHVRDNRVLIESSGPDGEQSHDWPLSAIGSLTTDRGPRLARLASLVVKLKSGESVSVLRGRDERELRWIAETIRQAQGGAAAT